MVLADWVALGVAVLDVVPLPLPVRVSVCDVVDDAVPLADGVGLPLRVTV